MLSTCPVTVSVPKPIFQLPFTHFHHPFSSVQLQKSKFQCLHTHSQFTSTSSVQLHKTDNTHTYNNLLSSYIKDNRLTDARNLFDLIPDRDEFSWSIIISGCCRRGNFAEAIDLFEQMMWDGFRPHEVVVGCLIKAIPGLRDVSIGRQLHGLSIKSGIVLVVSIRISLMTMYSNCGFFDNAKRIFDEVPLSLLHDASLWNAMFSIYLMNEHWTEAFELFGNMILTGLVDLNERFYASVISGCSNARLKKYGKIVHGRIVKDGMFDETVIGNSLVTFYAKCGKIDESNLLFTRMSRKDVVSWNSVIAGNEQNGQYMIAILLFRRMLRIGKTLRPNRITFLSILRAISGASVLKQGREVHAHIIRLGLECTTSIASSLIAMYSKCNEVQKAELVFDTLHSKDIVSWNSMLSGLEQNGKLLSFFKLFNTMLLHEIEPDSHTFTAVLSAASSLPHDLKHLIDGRAVHAYMLRRHSLEKLGVLTCNALLNMYTKNNRVDDAKNIFDEMSNNDTHTWNTMIDGYFLGGCFVEAVNVFLEMHEQGVSPDYMSLSIILTACGRSVSFHLGEQFHAFSIKHIGHHAFTRPTSLLSVHNALISMYVKCGSISDAYRIFIRMEKKDVFSWTAMITGYAQHGMAIKSFELFDKMKQYGVKPNAITFLGLLTACSHAGVVEDGIHYFSSMIEVLGLNPSIEHYACMVDLFGRSGQLDRAKKLVEVGSKHFKDNADCLSLWKVLLGACHTHKQLELGVYAALKILDSEPEDGTTHVLLMNLYAAAGMWDEATEVRRWMKDKGLKKQESGCSWIEDRDGKHIFAAGDLSHPQREEIYLKLEEVDVKCREMGYVPMTEYVLHDIDESHKEAIIGCHSEKLAVSFGLLQNGPGRKGVIRVMKNLRVCGDCHNWMKFCSQLERSEIVLRDSRRFHFFKDGKCSCGDYW